MTSNRRSAAVTRLFGLALGVLLSCERLPAGTPQAPAGTEHAGFQFTDGDRVILLGATFLEREQQFGHVESALTAAAGLNRVTFRNLGWDADTVFADSRGMFETPSVGYQRMIEQVRAEKPTVIIVCYGQNEALNPAQSVDEFQEQLRKLLLDLSPTKAKILWMSPHELFPTAPPVPSPSRFNSRLRQFTTAVQTVAESTSTVFVNLLDGFAADLATADRAIGLARSPAESGTEIPADPVQHRDLWTLAATRWSANGMHLNDRGYRAAGLVVRERLLGIPATPPEVIVDLENQSVESASSGIAIHNIRWGTGDEPIVSFEIQETILSPLPVVLQLKNAATEISGDVQTGDAQTGNEHMELLRTPRSQESPVDARSLIVPTHPQYERLTKLIVRKNELYFHRWRPQNITYLFGFRKHEQGNNAIEIAEFDPLVAELENEIQRQHKPAARTVLLTPGQ